MSEPVSCSKSFSALGAWWRPEKPDEQVAGSFVWDPREGGRLDLLGFFVDDGGDPTHFQAPIVHGVAEGNEYTLINCHTTQFNLRTPGVTTQQLRPFAGALAGILHPDPTEADFDRLTMDVDYVAELSGWTHITPRYASSDWERFDFVSIEYEHPSDVVANLRSESIRLASEWSSGGDPIGRAEIRETVRLVVDSRAPIGLSDLIERYVGPLRDLVTFAAQVPAAIRSVTVAGPSTTEVLDSGRTIKRPSEVLLPFLEGDARDSTTTRLRHSLLAIPTEPRALRSLLQSWLDLRQRLAPVIDLRFAASYARFTYGENRFLNAVQAVEALHRRALAGVPDPEDLEARAAVLAGCPDEHRLWLEGKLQYAHEPTLRRRLREVLDFVGTGLRPATGPPAKFINAVVTTRNELTHWDEHAHRKLGDDLHGLALVLGYVIDASLLRLLGYSADEVRSTLDANEHFRWVASRFATK